MSIPQPEDLSFYFHIPFCKKKCGYCHFYVIPDKESHMAMLQQGLQKEWQSWLPFFEGRSLTSIYFGGGTPSLYGPERIGEIISWVKERFPWEGSPPEITLEANPENSSPALLASYRQAGVNRVSIGIQSLSDRLLHVLSREHSAQEALNAVIAAHTAGFDNISIDLMYELPHQQLSHWRETLELASSLPISHLSLYNLTIEPKTSFYKNREALSLHLPNEETRLAMYEIAIEKLEEAGLCQYEVSAFAREDAYSRHNTGYWTGREFIGLGPSAFSYWEGKRFSNAAHIHRYCKALEEGASPVDFEEKLPPPDHLRELLAIGLRIKSGVNLEAFSRRFGTLNFEVEKALEKLAEAGLVNYTPSKHASLTKRGILFYDTVAEEIIA